MTLTAPAAHDHPAGFTHCDPGCPAWAGSELDPLAARYREPIVRLGFSFRDLMTPVLMRTVEALSLFAGALAVCGKQLRRYETDRRNVARLMRIRDRRRERRIRRGVRSETRRVS